jgi:hypothetical protein
MMWKLTKEEVVESIAYTSKKGQNDPEVSFFWQLQTLTLFVNYL